MKLYLYVRVILTMNLVLKKQQTKLNVSLSYTVYHASGGQAKYTAYVLMAYCTSFLIH